MSQAEAIKIRTCKQCKAEIKTTAKGMRDHAQFGCPKRKGE